MSLTSPALAGGFFASGATCEAKETWSGLPCPYPGDLPDPGMEPGYPALPADSFPLSHQAHLCMFQCSSLKSSHPPLLPVLTSLSFIFVSFSALHLSRFHTHASIDDVCLPLSDLLHSV